MSSTAIGGRLRAVGIGWSRSTILVVPLAAVNERTADDAVQYIENDVIGHVFGSYPLRDTSAALPRSLFRCELKRTAATVDALVSPG